MVDRSLLLVPSGIAHGPYLPMVSKMIIPFTTYYIHPSDKTMDAVIETLGGESSAVWREFFDLMMGSYKMEMKGPREYSAKELASFKAPLLIIASPKDVFFPADKVFRKAEKIFQGPIITKKINSKHLPSEVAMEKICNYTKRFFANKI